MKTVVEWLYRQAIRVAFYLDDGLHAHQFTEALQGELTTTLNLLLYLGWIINLLKSDLVPTRDLQYIGIRFQTGVNLVKVPQDRGDMIVSSVSRLLHAPASVHTWQEVLGLLTSAQDLIHRGRLQLRPLQRLLYPHLEFINRLVPLPAQLRCHLELWLQPSNVCDGVFMSEPPFILHLFVDASLEGWGAHFGGDQAARLWSPEEKVLHINCLEMEAVIRAVMFWKLRLCWKRLMIQSDNSTVVHCVNKQGTTQPAALLGPPPWPSDRLVAPSRSLRNPVQQPPSSIWVAGSRPTGMGPRRSSDIVGGSRRLRVFANGAVTIDTGDSSSNGQPTSALVATYWPARTWFPELLQIIDQPPFPLPDRDDLLFHPLNDHSVISASERVNDHNLSGSFGFRGAVSYGRQAH
ncbi:uncharacterized protein [Haliotis cracherodii]|uniref:uncharacterized protein n=1 Tax=Haliotis cracherodii TaxID=6455 RepID=UPI0039ED4060